MHIHVATIRASPEAGGLSEKPIRLFPTVGSCRPERLASSALTQAVLISERESTDVIPNVLSS